VWLSQKEDNKKRYIMCFFCIIQTIITLVETIKKKENFEVSLKKQGKFGGGAPFCIYIIYLNKLFFFSF